MFLPSLVTSPSPRKSQIWNERIIIIYCRHHDYTRIISILCILTYFILFYFIHYLFLIFIYFNLTYRFHLFPLLTLSFTYYSFLEVRFKCGDWVGYYGTIKKYSRYFLSLINRHHHHQHHFVNPYIYINF